jgi:peptidyl-tRNA hydrolase
MITEVFNNRFFELRFHHDLGILEYKASPETIDMTDLDIKEAFETISAAIEQYAAKCYLANQKEQNVAFTPNLQLWIVENVYPRWSKAGLKKVALEVPEEFIAALSLEQAVD